MTHEQLVNECLLALSARGILAWKNTTGEGWVGRIVNQAGGMLTLAGFRRVHFGLAGSTDILGILVGGRALVVECKTGTGRMRENQRNFRGAVEKRGGLHIEARSVEGMLDALDAALADAGVAA